MSNTERFRVVSLPAQSPAQETVGQTGLAGPLPSQQDNLPPEHAVQPLLLLLPLLTFLLEQQLNQQRFISTHLTMLTRWCLVDSVRTVQSVLPGLWCQTTTAATGSDPTGQCQE